MRSWSFRNLKLKKDQIEVIHTQQDQLIRQEEQSIMAIVVLTLPVKYREILLFYYYEELTMKEIASFLKISDNTVKTRTIKAHKELKDELPADY